MREFKNPGEFAEFLALLSARIVAAHHEGLERAAKVIEEEAKASIGHYQDAAGPFPAWPELSEATLKGFRHRDGSWIPGKEELGYAPPDNPLLREGHLRDSIEHKVEENVAVVGSSDEVAVYQELGEPRAEYPLPPRSFLGRAAFVKARACVEMIAHRVVWAMGGLPPQQD